MPDRANDLTVALGKTEKAVNRLSATVGVHESTLKRVSVASAVAMVGLLLDLTLTILVGLGLAGVNHNQDRINELQDRVLIENARNKSAQCAFIALFLQFEPRTTVNPTYTEEQRAQQKEAYTTLRQIGADLGCVSR